MAEDAMGAMRSSLFAKSADGPSVSGRLCRTNMNLCQTKLILLSVLCIAGLAASSPGDRDGSYRSGVQECLQKHACVVLNEDEFFHWSCEATCRYNCSLAITLQRIARGHRPLQYHGKWVFYSIFGMQEPASVLFALGNLFVHAHALFRPSARGWWLVFAVCSCTAWIFASLFHARDLPWTERMDYISAAAAVWSLAIASASHLFGSRFNHFYLFVLGGGLALHAPLLLPTIKYGENMKACIAVTVFVLFLWIIWMARNFRRPHFNKLALFLALTTAFSLLEAFDFPPWGLVLDAHSLWHCGTIFTSALFWSFLDDDLCFRAHATAVQHNAAPVREDPSTGVEEKRADGMG